MHALRSLVLVLALGLGAAACEPIAPLPTAHAAAVEGVLYPALADFLAAARKARTWLRYAA